MAPTHILLAALLCVAACQAYSLETYCQAPRLSEDKWLPKTNASLKLTQAQLFFRHGDRTPVDGLPNENVEWHCALHQLQSFSQDVGSDAAPSIIAHQLYNARPSPLKGNCSLGQLTDKGLEQHKELGKHFRRMYVDTHKLVQPTFDPSSVNLRSTDYGRTFHSLEGNLLGFFPQNGLRSMTRHIVVETTTGDLENLTPNGNVCPKFDTEQLQLQQTFEWKEHEAKWAPFMEELAELVGVDPKGTWGFGAIVDPLMCRYCHDKDLPKGVTDDMLATAKWLVDWEEEYYSRVQRWCMLGMSTVVEDILKLQENAILGKAGKPLYINSAHDYTVWPLLSALRVFDGHWPPYTAHVSIELWTDADSGKNYVRVLYNDEVAQVPGCDGDLCTWAQWNDAVAWAISDDYEKDCGVPKVRVPINPLWMLHDRSRSKA